MIFFGGVILSLASRSRWVLVSSAVCRNVPAGPVKVPRVSSLAMLFAFPGAAIVADSAVTAQAIGTRGVGKCEQHANLFVSIRKCKNFRGKTGRTDTNTESPLCLCRSLGQSN